MGLLSKRKTPKEDAIMTTTAGAGTAAATTPASQEGAPKNARFADSPGGDEDKEAAAAKIQAIKRGKADRAKVTEEKQISKMKEDREKAAVKVQAIAKGRADRKAVEAKKSGSKPSPLKGMIDSLVELLKCAKCVGGGAAAATTAPQASRLTPKLREKVQQLFAKMDIDGDGKVNESEAISFFKSFAKLSARAMLNEVDTDRNGSATYEEMCDFWENVMSTGQYEEDELLEEIDALLEGQAWRDYNDDRTT